MQREVQSPQRKVRQLFVKINGTGTAAVVEGVGLVTLVDNGTGDYTITLVQPSVRKPVVTITCATTDCYAEMVDADNTTSVIHVLTKINADTATDAIFHMNIACFDTADI